MDVRKGTILVTTNGDAGVVPYAILAGYVLCGLTLLLVLWWALKADKPAAGLAILLLVAGFASHAMNGFSPTIWISGYRTFIVLHFAVLVCVVLLFQRLRELGFSRERLVLGMLGLAAGVSYAAWLAWALMGRLMAS